MPITILAAFLGGFLSLLSPCSALVIPTYTALITKHLYHPLKSTIIFSLGLLVSFLPLAFGISLLSDVILHYRRPVTLFIGIFLVIGAVALLIFKQLPIPEIKSPILNHYRPHSPKATAFILGIIAGLGSTTCVGPVLGAILTLAATQSDIFSSVSLMLAYLLGIVLPLVLLSVNSQLFGQRLITKYSHLTFHLGRFSFPFIQTVSAMLLFFLAYIFIWHQGNLHHLPLIGNSDFFHSTLDLQDRLFEP